MFFRLTNSPAIFQIMVNKNLWDLINTRKVASFIDNIIVGIEKEEGHNEVVDKMAKRLEKNNLYIKLEKYKWKIRKIGFLRVVIELEGIKMEEEKMKEVLDQPTLKRVKDVQNFLELANYYWQFIKDFIVIARLLYNPVKKDQKQNWTKKQERKFRELKKRFTKEPILVAPDLDKK